MPWLDLARLAPDPAALAAGWRSARPFPHLVLDALLPPDAQLDLLDAIADEACTLLHDEIFELLASAPAVTHPVLRALRDELGGPPFCDLLRRVTGKSVARAELRAFAYEPGHYLLPHSDHQRGVGRALAFAYYLDTPFPVTGGELELFDCILDGDGEIVATPSVCRIEPVPNRLVVFDVGDASLHQVREVTAGTRLSLSGWFYP